MIIGLKVTYTVVCGRCGVEESLPVREHPGRNVRIGITGKLVMDIITNACIKLPPKWSYTPNNRPMCPTCVTRKELHGE